MRDVSIISAVMNRPDRVAGALGNWLAAEGVAEIVLVDWSSIEPVPDHPDERVRVVRVEGEPHWILTRAFNLAAELAVKPLLVKMDIDYRIEADFITRLELKPKRFWRGKTAVARDENERHLCGFMACRAEDFWAVGGYNERMSGYGMDDWDLYHRMRAIRLRQNIMKGEYGISHLPHPAEDRAVNLEEQDIEYTNDRNKREALRSPWTGKDARTEYDVKADGSVVKSCKNQVLL